MSMGLGLSDCWCPDGKQQFKTIKFFLIFLRLVVMNLMALTRPAWNCTAAAAAAIKKHAHIPSYNTAGYTRLPKRKKDHLLVHFLACHSEILIIQASWHFHVWQKNHKDFLGEIDARWCCCERINIQNWLWHRQNYFALSNLMNDDELTNMVCDELLLL